MKKIGSLLLSLILCFSIVGCSSGKSTADITKSFEELGYELNTFEDDDNNVLVLTKDEKAGSIQLTVYLDKKSNDVTSAGYIYSPTDNDDLDNLVVGFVYVDSDSKYEVSDDIKKIVEDIFKKIDLTLDEFIDYAPDAYNSEK